MDIKIQNTSPGVYAKIEALIKEYISSLEFEEVEKAKKIIEQSKVILAEAESKKVEIAVLDEKITEKGQDLKAIDEKKKLLTNDIEVNSSVLTELQINIDNIKQDIVNFGVEKEQKQQELNTFFNQIEEKKNELSELQSELTKIKNSIIDEASVLENRKEIYKQKLNELKNKSLKDKNTIKKEKVLYKQLFESYKIQKEEEKKGIDLSLENVKKELSIVEVDLKQKKEEIKNIVIFQELLKEVEILRVEKIELEMSTNSLASDKGALESTLESLKEDIIIGLQEYATLSENHSNLLEKNTEEIIKINKEREKIQKEKEDLENDKKNFKEVSGLLNQKKISLDNYKNNLQKIVNKAILLDNNSELHNILSLINKL